MRESVVCDVADRGVEMRVKKREPIIYWLAHSMIWTKKSDDDDPDGEISATASHKFME